jgi:hypothetical protein
VNCEHDNDDDECDWGSGSGDAASASLFCSGQSGRRCADGVRRSADGGFCAGAAAGTVAGSGMVVALTTGAPAVVQSQVRTQVEASVQLEFESWGKLQLALAAGSQQMNLLKTATGVSANGSGGVAAAAVPLAAGSTASTLNVGATAAAQFHIGDLVAVDMDYVDVNYVRRVSLNVGRIVGIANGMLQLGGPLLAGAPAAGMQVSALVGFVDREGGGFFQEWSGLFVMDGEQGDRVIYHYPRLQAMQSSAEMVEALGGTLERVKLAGAFRALPVKDANDGETVLCFRSYLPGAMRAV